MNDSQYEALGTIASVQDPDLGNVKMTNVPFRMSETPGDIRFSGRKHGHDTSEVLTQLGYTEAEIDSMREAGGV